jgi:hypothetical protein
MNIWFALTSYSRATTETDAPGRNVAATISRFSASGQRLLRRFPPLVSTSDIVGTSPHRVERIGHLAALARIIEVFEMLKPFNDLIVGLLGLGLSMSHGGPHHESKDL